MEWQKAPLENDTDIITKKLEEETTNANPAVQVGVERGLCVFQPKEADVGVHEIEIVEYMPLASISKGKMIEFHIPVTSNFYWNLKKSVLSMKVRIVRASDGSGIGKDDMVAFVQAPAYSLFKSCEVSLQQRLLSPDVGPMYSMKAVLDLLLYHPEEYLSSRAQSFLYYKDNEPMNSTSMTGEGANRGLLQRFQFTSLGKEVQMECGLAHDIWNVTGYIPRNMEMRVKLYPNDENYVLMTASTTERYSYEITLCVLKMYGISPTEGTLQKHHQLLGKQNAFYYYTRSVVKTHAIGPGLTNWSTSQIFGSDLPYEMVVGFVNTEALNGKVTLNPFNFLHLNLINIALKIEKYQDITYTPNFANLHCAREYSALYDYEDASLPHGNIIKRVEFHQGYTLYRFQLGPSAYERLSRPKTGQTHLSVRFGTTLTDGVTIIIYGRFHDYLQIDKKMKVITSDQ